MTSAWKQLQKTFLDDHRTMTRGYRDLLTAIELRDFAAAAQLAANLDELAGPHIEFEEQCLYPEIESIRGEAYASRLYGEHAEILRVLLELQALTAETPPTDDDVASWTEGLRHGLEHAAACGSLLSHLQAQSPEQLERSWESLKGLRKQRHRWSELQPSTNARKSD